MNKEYASAERAWLGDGRTECRKMIGFIKEMEVAFPEKRSIESDEINAWVSLRKVFNTDDAKKYFKVESRTNKPRLSDEEVEAKKAEMMRLYDELTKQTEASRYTVEKDPHTGNMIIYLPNK